MRAIRSFGDDIIARADEPACDGDGHNATFAHYSAIGFDCDVLQQARRECFDLAAWIAQAGHFQDDTLTDTKQSVATKSQQVDPRRRDILSEVARFDREAFLAQFVEQLCVDQVHLPEIGAIRIDPHARKMLDLLPRMRVAQDAKSGYDLNSIGRRLGKSMLVVARDGNYTRHSLRRNRRSGL